MKQTSYQRLKAENKKLKKHIYMLVMRPKDTESEIIHRRYWAEFNLSDLAWYGTPTTNDISPNKNQQS